MQGQGSEIAKPAETQMILIENNETQEYLTSLGNWSKNPLEGKSFSSATVALEAARQETPVKFNIVFYFPQKNQFLRLNYCWNARTQGQGN
jgi:hypothetical protein